VLIPAYARPFFIFSYAPQKPPVSPLEKGDGRGYEKREGFPGKGLLREKLAF